MQGCETGEEADNVRSHRFFDVRQEERSAMHTQLAWRSSAFMMAGASAVKVFS